MKDALRLSAAMADRFGLFAAACLAAIWIVLSDASPLTGLVVVLGFGAFAAIEAGGSLPYED